MEAAARLVDGWNDGRQTLDAMAALNIEVPQDGAPADDGALELWPDNVEPVIVFRRMGTQWAVGPHGGPVGLRYEALPVVLDVCGIAPERRGAVIDAVQVMERKAIELMNARR